METKPLAKHEVAEHAPYVVKQIFDRAHRANVSMLAVCRKAGVHHDVVGRWRRGQTAPTVSTLEKIIDAIVWFEKNPPTIPL